MWYTTPAFSSLGILSLGCTSWLLKELYGFRCTVTPALLMVLATASDNEPTYGSRTLPLFFVVVFGSLATVCALGLLAVAHADLV